MTIAVGMAYKWVEVRPSLITKASGWRHACVPITVCRAWPRHINIWVEIGEAISLTTYLSHHIQIQSQSYKSHPNPHLALWPPTPHGVIYVGRYVPLDQRIFKEDKTGRWSPDIPTSLQTNCLISRLVATIFYCHLWFFWKPSILLPTNPINTQHSYKKI